MPEWNGRTTISHDSTRRVYSRRGGTAYSRGTAIRRGPRATQRGLDRKNMNELRQRSSSVRCFLSQLRASFKHKIHIEMRMRTHDIFCVKMKNNLSNPQIYIPIFATRDILNRSTHVDPCGRARNQRSPSLTQNNTKAKGLHMTFSPRTFQSRCLYTAS